MGRREQYISYQIPTFIMSSMLQPKAPERQTRLTKKIIKSIICPVKNKEN